MSTGSLPTPTTATLSTHLTPHALLLTSRTVGIFLIIELAGQKPSAGAYLPQELALAEQRNHHDTKPKRICTCRLVTGRRQRLGPSFHYEILTPASAVGWSTSVRSRRVATASMFPTPLSAAGSPTAARSPSRTSLASTFTNPPSAVGSSTAAPITAANTASTFSPPPRRRDHQQRPDHGGGGRYLGQELKPRPRDQQQRHDRGA